MIRCLLSRLRLPMLVLAVTMLPGCSALSKDWNALSPAEKEKLVQDALTEAQKLCAQYDGSGGAKNEALQTACLGLKIGTAVDESEEPAPSTSSSAMPVGSAN